MTKKYFEEIEILEGVILKLNNEEALIQRDWSSFFDIQKDIKLYSIQKDNKDYEIFLERLFLKLNYKFRSIQEYFEIDETTKINDLNKRIYIFNENKKEELKKFIANFYNNYLQENYIKNEFDISFIEDDNFSLKKLFNTKEFFSNHESLFDKENDFLQNKKVFLGLKNEKKEELNTLEDQINKLKSEQKFYVKVNLKNLENENMKFDGSKKYENIFILERGDYIYHTKKEKNG